MKHIGIIFLFITITYQLQAQVGINTTSPKGILHIDPKGDTNGDSNTSDDIVILDNGRLGIGTTSPSANLDLRGKLRISDGTEGDSKILLSDNDGVAYWGNKSLRIIHGYIPNQLSNVLGGGNNTSGYVGANITLQEGTWIVHFLANYKSSSKRGGNVWWDLSSSSTTRNTTGGRCVSNFVYPNTICSTYSVYLVTTTETATYYVWSTAYNLATGDILSYVGNGQIYAIRVK